MTAPRLSENFKRSECICQCGECNQYGADIELVNALEALRAYVRRRSLAEAIIVVTSWFRCTAHNNRPANAKNANGVYGAGSNDRSWHLSGSAADIKVPGLPALVLYQSAINLFSGKYGIGLYDWGIHIDIRPNAARWDSRT